MDYALLSLRYGNPTAFPRMLTSTRLEMMIISTRSLTKPLDFLFRNKPSPPIPSSQILCDTSKLLRWPQLGHHGLISPMVRAHGGRVSAPSSTGGEKGNGERSTRIISSMQAIIGVSLALACILAIFCSSSTLSMLSPRNAVATTTRIHTAIPSQTKSERNVISPISGQLALSLFMDAVVYLGSSKFNSLPPAKIYREDVAKLRAKALALMRKGEPNKALKKMEHESKKYVGTEGEFHFEMALVELLILQWGLITGASIFLLNYYWKGKYKEASAKKCLKETDDTKTGPSDMTRRSLYKAIIYTVLGDKVRAKAAWQQFIENGFEGGPDT